MFSLSIGRWTAGRRAAHVGETNPGKTMQAESARTSDPAPRRSRRGPRNGLANTLKSKPLGRCWHYEEHSAAFKRSVVKPRSKKHRAVMAAAGHPGSSAAAKAAGVRRGL